MRILSNKHNQNITKARYLGYFRDSEYIGYRHTIWTRKAIWCHSVSSNEQVHYILVLAHKYFLPSHWAAVLTPTYPLPVPSGYLITLHQSVPQNLSHMWLSTFQIGAAHFRSVKADLNGKIFPYDYRARLAYVMTFDHPHAHYFHLRHPHVSYVCRLLIYTTRSVVKSWRMLVAHDSRKQKSCRLNRPLQKLRRNDRSWLWTEALSGYGFHAGTGAIWYTMNIALVSLLARVRYSWILSRETSVIQLCRGFSC